MENKLNFRKILRIFSYLTVVIFIIMIVILAIMFLGYMENTTSGRGVFEGFYEYQMKSSVMSKIKKIVKNEGDKIKKGDVLLYLDDRDLREKIGLAKNDIAELEAQIDVAEAELEVKKHDPLPKEYRHTKISLDTALLKCQKSEKEQEIFQKLYDRNVISLLALQQKQLNHLSNLSEYKTRQKDYTLLQNGLAKKIIAKAASELALLKTKLKNKKNELALLSQHLDDYVFKSPEDGIIRYIPNKPGAYVVPGDTMVRIATTDKKKFTVYIDEKHIFRIQEGQKARISSSQYNYLEYGYFTGKVIHIGGMPEKRGLTNFYPVKIMLTEEPQAIRLGSTGEADIITGRERIIICLMEWNK